MFEYKDKQIETLIKYIGYVKSEKLFKASWLYMIPIFNFIRFINIFCLKLFVINFKLLVLILLWEMKRIYYIKWRNHYAILEMGVINRIFIFCENWAIFCAYIYNNLI